ncbi:MAG: nucleoside kinase [Clostridia bacterium]|nr:nucleoside kinase [Clostridia bacterium]MBQ7052903.1 nucleoside kinase [Clostridia bacterium]
MSIQNEEKRRIHERSVRMILLLALRDVCPGAVLEIEHSIGFGVYMNVRGVSLTAAIVRRIEARMHEIVQQDLPIEKARWSKEDAIAYFSTQGQDDTVRLLSYRKFDYFNMYTCAGLSDYYYGEMAPSTGSVCDFALRLYYPGMVLLLPGDDLSAPPAPFVERPQLMRTYAEANAHSSILQCVSAADLNDIIAGGEARTFIRVNEALHDRAIAQIAERIVARGARVVFVAGPSSSGKTTFANRLGIQLRVSGKRPLAISLDDYYLNRSDVPLGPDGKPDLECLEALDVALFNEQLVDLLAGREVELPRYSFQTKSREPKGRKLSVAEDQVLIVEGIHGLNDRLSAGIPSEMKYRVYVSALTQLNLDRHNRIRTTDVRLLRRMVRDYRSRATGVLETMEMWDKVREGEEKYIFPLQENADVMFNTSLLYEIAVLRKYAYPLLLEVGEDSPYYVRARRLVKFLNYFLDCEDENEIPPTSILREFVGGCTFYDH